MKQKIGLNPNTFLFDEQNSSPKVWQLPPDLVFGFSVLGSFEKEKNTKQMSRMLQARGRHESVSANRQLMAQRRAYEKALKPHTLEGGAMDWEKTVKASNEALTMYQEGKSAKEILLHLVKTYGKDIAETAYKHLFG